jgi:hypothetical protein
MTEVSLKAFDEAVSRHLDQGDRLVTENRVAAYLKEKRTLEKEKSVLRNLEKFIRKFRKRHLG